MSCTATTRKGAPCRGRPVKGTTRCSAHGGRRVSEEKQLAGVVVAAALDGDWRAAAWVLERRYPHWRRGSQIEERPPVSTPPADALDDLAGRREARRAAR